MSVSTSDEDGLSSEAYEELQQKFFGDQEEISPLKYAPKVEAEDLESISANNNDQIQLDDMHMYYNSPGQMYNTQNKSLSPGELMVDNNIMGKMSLDCGWIPKAKPAEVLKEEFSVLTEREGVVIRLRYGLYEKLKPMKLSEIGIRCLDLFFH